MPDYRIISADSHVMEPANLWTSRAESKFKDRVPHVESLEEGEYWFCDGARVDTVAGGTQVGLRFEEPEKLSSKGGKTENVILGGYIPEEHVKDMDIDGVDVSIVYPTICLQLYTYVPDSELLNSLFRTYNDWIGEFCSAVPRRLKGIAVINVDDVRTGVKELERCAKLGFAGAMITITPPEGRSYDKPEYEPLWAVAQDLAMPLSLHAATIRAGAAPNLDFTPAISVNLDYWVRTSIANLIFSGVFERYPDLQVGSVEQDLAWAPYFLQQIDYRYTQAMRELMKHRFKGDVLPSDFFHNNVFLGFQEDALGIRDRHIIGVDQLQWGSDYPHPESTFPRSRQILEEILSGCTEEEKAKIAGGNSARVYNLN